MASTSGTCLIDYLKKLFPSLFVNLDIYVFKCDVCELVKSHLASFPLILNKILVPFMISILMFGDHPKFLHWGDHGGLLHLLMIVPGWLSYIWRNPNMRLVCSFRSFIKQFVLSTMPKYKCYGVTMAGNTNVLNFNIFWKTMAHPSNQLFEHA